MNRRVRSLALGVLLFVMPFSGIRVICIESRAEGNHSAAPATHTETAAEERPLTECERLCPFHPPASVQAPDADALSASSDEDSDCALSSDASALHMLGTIAVLRPAQPLAVPHVVSDAPVHAAPHYAEPSLIHLGPPPKSTAL